MAGALGISIVCRGTAFPYKHPRGPAVVLIPSAAVALYLSCTSTNSPGPTVHQPDPFLTCAWSLTMPANEVKNCRHFLEGKQENCPKNQVIFKCQKHPVRESRLSTSTGIWQSDKQWFTALKVTWKQSSSQKWREKDPRPAPRSHLRRQAQLFSHL